MSNAPFERTVLGSGGGSSSSDGSSRTPVVANDTVQSQALLSILDLICEGQVKGLVPDAVGSGTGGIFLDKTPVSNPDGSLNFQGFDAQFRNGSQYQSVMAGFPDVSTPYNVSVQIKQSTPQTITVSDPDADAVRVIMSIPALSSQDVNTGDVSGTTVQYSFSLSVGNSTFYPVEVSGTGSSVVTISDKSRSKYQREHLIYLPKPGSNYRIRITRITPDTASTYLANDTFLDSYYEIVNSQLFYPNSVMCGVRVNSEQFSTLPSRSYLIDGLLIRIPSNYDPETRIYNGVWDGSFAIGFSNNPAWVLYDLLINTRYGLGEFVKPSNINIAKLYQIGRYCDQMLSNGFGGLEPRFTINTSIASRNDAYKVISDLCSTFRGMSYWSGGMVQVTQDSPTDPVYLFNNANVVDGMFNRSGSARKDRHSVVNVQWNDPDDQYRQKIEYVEDAGLIQSLGYRKMDTIAFGCTSRAQAHRVGLWILYTEKAETNITNFEVGLDGLTVVPGDIVQISDQWKAGKRNGGRLVASSRTGCTLDKPTDISIGSMIAIRMPNGQFEEKQVATTGAGLTAITFTSQLSAVPLANTVWILIEASLVPQLGRVVGISQSSKPNQFVISVVDHNPSKFNSIEQGLALELLPTTLIDPTFSTPESMKIEEVTYLAAPGQLASRLDVSWQGKSPTYFVSYRVSKGSWVSGWQTTATPKASFEVYNATGGAVYDFQVVGQSVTGKLSGMLVGTYVALGTMNPPPPPTNLTAVGDFRQILLNWTNAVCVDFDFVEIFENTSDNVDTAYYLDRTPGNSYTRGGIPGFMEYWYWVRTVNKRGMRSAFNSTAGTSAIGGFIAKTDLDAALSKTIDDISGNLDGLVDDVLVRVNAITDGLPDRVAEAEALAAAARAGNNIESMLRDDENVNLQRDVYNLSVSVNDNIAAEIQNINQVMATDRQSVASSMQLVQAKFDASDAALVAEQTARSTADDATATSITGLTAKTDATNAALTSEQTTRATADTALSSSITSLNAKTDTTNANLTTEQTARANADTALSTSITSLNAKTDTTNASLATELTTRATADTALASSVTALSVKTTGDIAAAISSEQTARASAEGALSTRIDSTVASVGVNSTAIQSETTARVTADAALGTRIDTLVAKTDTANAALVIEQTTRANADGALSTLVTTAQATADGANTSVQTTSSALAGLNGSLSSQWTAKVQTMSNGMTYLAGMGIGIQNTSQGIVQSQIAMQADRVVMVNPLTNASVYPFQLINGIVYLNTAVINNASITNAMIQNASITSAKIANAQINSAHINNAQILNAHIGDLQVDTLKIGNESVIIPRWAGYAPNFGCNGGWQTPLTLTFTLPQAGMTFLNYCAGFNSSGEQSYSYQLVCDGSLLASSTAIWSDSSITLAGAMWLAAGSHTASFNIIGSPGVVLSYQNLIVQGIMK